ncbi:hypothetical protein [Tellurirhabdus rosea]|uniref:hypothetical protein n=1 Tax=Tellurirhabdus rosea TaxID=2674997 RepID=UPI00224E568E|nr:hypothetical protein [Tellurirhabdus rosea]
MLDHFISLVQKFPLSIFAEVFTVVPIAAGIIQFKRLGPGMKALMLLLALILLRDSVSDYFAARQISNLFLYNTSALLEAILVYFIFIGNLKNKRTKRYILYTLLLTTIAGLLFWSNAEISSETLVLSKVFNIIIVLTYFNYLLSELRIANILIHSLFWVGSGLILQATGTFFVYLFSKIIFSTQSDPEIFVYYWNFGQMMYVIFCCFAAVGLWVSKYEGVDNQSLS